MCCLLRLRRCIHTYTQGERTDRLYTLLSQADSAAAEEERLRAARFTVNKVHHNAICTLHRLPLATYCLLLAAHRSLLTAHHSPLTTHRSPLTAHRSPLAAHRSPLTAHRSPLTAHHSPLTNHRSPLTASLLLPEERHAIATSITASLEAWVEATEIEISSLSGPAAKSVTLVSSWNDSPLPELTFFSEYPPAGLTRDFEQARDRLCRREADLAELTVATTRELPTTSVVSVDSGLARSLSKEEIPEEGWEVRKLAELRETAEAQAKLRPLLHAASVAQESLREMEAECVALSVTIQKAYSLVTARIERWDTDDLSAHWAAAAQKLHPFDWKTAALLEKRRQLRERAATEVNEKVPAALTALPLHEEQVCEALGRCEAYHGELLPSSLLMLEEIVVSDQIASLAEARWRAELAPEESGRVRATW